MVLNDEEHTEANDSQLVPSHAQLSSDGSQQTHRCSTENERLQTNGVLRGRLHHLLGEYGALSEEHGPSSEEHGALSEEHGPLSEEYEALSEEHGALSEEHGALRPHVLLDEAQQFPHG